MLHTFSPNQSFVINLLSTLRYKFLGQCNSYQVADLYLCPWISVSQSRNLLLQFKLKGQKDLVTKCTASAVEDEQHFLIECSKFKTILYINKCSVDSFSNGNSLTANNILSKLVHLDNHLYFLQYQIIDMMFI